MNLKRFFFQVCVRVCVYGIVCGKMTLVRLLARTYPAFPENRCTSLCRASNKSLHRAAANTAAAGRESIRVNVLFGGNIMVMLLPATASDPLKRLFSFLIECKRSHV